MLQGLFCNTSVVERKSNNNNTPTARLVDRHGRRGSYLCAWKRVAKRERDFRCALPSSESPLFGVFVRERRRQPSDTAARRCGGRGRRRGRGTGEKKKKSNTTTKPDGPSGLMTAAAHVLLRPHDGGRARSFARSVANLITCVARSAYTASGASRRASARRVKTPPPVAASSVIRAGNVVSVPERDSVHAANFSARRTTTLHCLRRPLFSPPPPQHGNVFSGNYGRPAVFVLRHRDASPRTGTAVRPTSRFPTANSSIGSLRRVPHPYRR
uniref:Uncharacterized protein n=1 Tax=Sipha flava TaxID=143950 RepID=A0A2S2QR33_9HEMI